MKDQMREEATRVAELAREQEETRNEFCAFRTQILFCYLLINGLCVLWAVQYASDKIVLGFIIGAVAVLNSIRFFFSTLYLIGDYARCLFPAAPSTRRRAQAESTGLQQPLLQEAAINIVEEVVTEIKQGGTSNIGKYCIGQNVEAPFRGVVVRITPNEAGAVSGPGVLDIRTHIA
jgi:hypothetical protein